MNKVFVDLMIRRNCYDLIYFSLGANLIQFSLYTIDVALVTCIRSSFTTYYPSRYNKLYFPNLGTT